MNDSTPRRRVAVTVTGAASPAGVGADRLWEAVARAEDAPVRRDVPDFDGTRWFERRDLRRTEPFAQYAVAAAVEAWTQAGEPAFDPHRAGVALGNAFGAAAALERAAATSSREGLAAVPAAVGLAACSSVAAAEVARRFGVTGHVAVTSGACASGIYGVADGARLIAYGEADLVFAGGTEGSVGPVVTAAYANLRAMSRSGRVRPFDRRRDGFVYSEGAAVLVLEPWEAAIARGATILGEVAGWANTNDADDLVRPTGIGVEACMRLAVERAGLDPADIVHVNADGTGTALNDPIEADAVRAVLGRDSQASVTSVKGRAGHGAGAAGALEAVVVLRSFAERLLPPVASDLDLDPAVTVDVVAGAPRPWEPGPTLDNGFGIGGQNGCLVLVPAGWTRRLDPPA